MAYDEEHHRRSRVVVETPAARREVVETRAAYAVPERRGVSTGVVALVAITAVVLTAIVAWALTRPSADEVTTTTMNSRTAATQPTPITQVVTVPVPQQQPQPVVVPPATTTTTQPIIVPAPSTTAPSTSTSTEAPRSSGSDDSSIQASIERKFADDPKVAALGISVMVLEGKVTLTGSVDSREMKTRVERMARVKGVKSVDNQITVTGADTSSSTQD